MTYNGESKKTHIFFRPGAGRGIPLSCNQCARANGLTGWVDNLWDGRVEMEVQGELSQIEEMIQEIQSGSFIRIEKYQMEDLPVDEEEWSFYAR